MSVGYVKTITPLEIQGWIENDDTITVTHNESVVATLTPSHDKNSNHYIFTYHVSPMFLDGHEHHLHFHATSTGQPLDQSPIRIKFLYESMYTPFQSTDVTQQRVLVLAPHADDETFACGGTLIYHANAGDDVKVVILTDGAKGDISTIGTSDYIQTRQDEAQNACNILGVNDIQFLLFADRDLLHNHDVVSKLETIIESYQPTWIYCPSPLEYHPDHQATAIIVWDILQHLSLQVQVAFWGMNRPLRPNTLVDISDVIHRKKKACDQYRSQLLNHPYTDLVLALNRYSSLTISPSCTYAEAFYVMDSRAICGLPIEVFGQRQVMSENTDDLMSSGSIQSRHQIVKNLEHQNRDLQAHIEYLEQIVNKPPLLASIYRAILPLPFRQWLHSVLDR